MAVVVLGGFMLLFAYLMRDLAYGVADPRVRRS
jgi:ABC-type dipeptide/oligopeptide/nickel transport system permease component